MNRAHYLNTITLRDRHICDKSAQENVHAGIQIVGVHCKILSTLLLHLKCFIIFIIKLLEREPIPKLWLLKQFSIFYQWSISRIATPLKNCSLDPKGSPLVQLCLGAEPGEFCSFNLLWRPEPTPSPTPRLSSQPPLAISISFLPNLIPRSHIRLLLHYFQARASSLLKSILSVHFISLLMTIYDLIQLFHPLFPVYTSVIFPTTHYSSFTDHLVYEVALI